jgi:hypothetical protein
LANAAKDDVEHATGVLPRHDKAEGYVFFMCAVRKSITFFGVLLRQRSDNVTAAELRSLACSEGRTPTCRRVTISLETHQPTILAISAERRCSKQAIT